LVVRCRTIIIILDVTIRWGIVLHIRPVIIISIGLRIIEVIISRRQNRSRKTILWTSIKIRLRRSTRWIIRTGRVGIRSRVLIWCKHRRTTTIRGFISAKGS
jgi:hypothetical protein